MSSQNTPRKFSEKIAMMTRKQNEDQEAFRSVMNDVRSITKKPNAPSAGSSNGSSPVGITSPHLSPTGPQVMYAPGIGSQYHLTSQMAPWNRPSASLPNVHQAVHQQPPNGNDGFTDFQYWQNQPAPNGVTPTGSGGISPASSSAAGHSYAQTHRTRSPGAQHYHPYNHRKSNERLSTYDHGMIPSVHLQPPDPSWGNRARSDPTIHMNAMTPSQQQMGYQGQQWSPTTQFQTNGMYQQSQQATMQQQQMQQQPMQHQQQQVDQQSAYGYPSQNGPVTCPSYSRSSGMSSVGMSYEQQMQQQRYANMAMSSSPTSQQQQQQAAAAAYMAQQHSPNHMQYQQQQHYQQQQQQMAVMQQQQAMAAAACGQSRQNLSTPAVVSESQSAPTSPAQTGDIPMQPQWPPTRHYSASPETMEIPKIVLNDTDNHHTNNLDCFQDLHNLRLDSDDMNLLTDSQLDPSCETQLLNN